MLAVIASAIWFAKRKGSLDQICAALMRIGQNVRWAHRHHAYVPIRVIRGQLSANNSALALFDELDDLGDLFGLRQFLAHRFNCLARVVF